ncbi:MULTISPECIES: hypothetical protein [unclassified Variovorax]|uniref:hypothetical protein n=1 Tax=unclassified Variovorax TaxID=663243 RepID=UPI00131C7313|nr:MULTISPECIES: hypothetical protein [unclassified Variovorax]QRY30894.1 hypothetical protein JVX96_22840 [Variovorax sp. PDNC026]
MGTIHSRLGDPRINTGSGEANALIPERTPELLQTALTYALGSVPYNSATQFLEFFDERILAPNWGMSCVRQSVRVDEHLQSIGGPKGIYIRNGRHVASIYPDSHGIAVLDPYLLHKAPLILNYEDRVGDCIEASVPAYPVRIDDEGLARWGKMRAVLNVEKRTLQLDYTRFSPRRQQNYLYRSFGLSLDEVAIFPSPLPVAHARLVHPEQNNLSVRVLDLPRQALSEVILPLCGVTADRPATEDQLISRDNQGRVSTAGSPGFDENLTSVARVVGVSAQEVVDILLHTSRVYSKVAPDDRVLAPYPLMRE